MLSLVVVSVLLVGAIGVGQDWCRDRDLPCASWLKHCDLEVLLIVNENQYLFILNQGLLVLLIVPDKCMCGIVFMIFTRQV